MQTLSLPALAWRLLEIFQRSSCSLEKPCNSVRPSIRIAEAHVSSFCKFAKLRRPLCLASSPTDKLRRAGSLASHKLVCYLFRAATHSAGRGR